MTYSPPQPIPVQRTDIITNGDTRYFPAATATYFVSYSTGTAWTTANVAVFQPFVLWEPVTLFKLGWTNGTSVSTNVDCGVYDTNGNRLISTGSTARSGTQVWQWVDVADTALAAGNYFLAFNSDATTASNAAGWGSVAGNITVATLTGAKEQAVGAVTLPNPATMTAQTISRTVNLCGFSIRAAAA